jgi:iron complex outermembrane receptor protein
MKIVTSRVRFATLSIAAVAAFPAAAQTASVSALKEVVVTTSRFEESADTLPYSVGVITAEDIHDSGVSTVSEAIIRLLGIPGKLDTSGGNSQTLDLRGFGETASSNQVIVVDGRRMNEADMSVANLSSIAIDSIQAIEVLRGSGAVLYGEGATGGVIVITTKAGKGVQRQTGATLTGSVGSQGLRDLRSTAVLVAGSWSIDVAAQDRKSDGHRENFASTSNSLASTVHWSNDQLRVGVQAGRTLQQSGLPGALSWAQFGTDATQAASKTDWAKSKFENTGVFAQTWFGDWELGLDVGQRTKQLESENYGLTAYQVEGSSANVRARHQKDGDLFKNVLTVGFDNNQWKRSNSMFYGSPSATIGKSDSNAVYFTDDVTYRPTATKLSIGLRSDSITKSQTSNPLAKANETQQAWNVGLWQPVTGDVSVFGRLGQSYRLPNIDEMAYSFASVLQTQQSKDAELGARWVTDTSRVELRWYSSNLSNEIGFNGTSNVNFDPTRHQGLELEAHHALTNAIKLRANLASRQNQFVDGPNSGKDIYLVPAQTAALGLDWKLAGGHSVSSGITWVSSQYVDQAKTCSVPAYSTVDARYAYSAGRVEFAVGVKNLANAKYFALSYGCPGSPSDSVYPEPGRSVVATVQAKF